MNTTFKVMESALIMGKFGIDAEVLDIEIGMLYYDYLG